MKKRFISVLIIFLLVLADFNILQYVRFFGKNLDLLIVTLIFFTLFYKFSLSLPLIIFAGVLRDILSASLFGLHTTTFLIWGLLMVVVSEWIVKENIWVEMLYTFVMTVFILSFLHISEFIFRGNLSYFETVFLQSIIPKGIISGLISPLWFKGLSKILS